MPAFGYQPVTHESYTNAKFNEYYKNANIITLYLPSHSSHLTQPLDIDIFSLLKKIYSSQISYLARAGVTHIIKNDFFPAFRAAFDAVFTKQNIENGFRGSGLSPLNPEAVISKLDIKLRIPSSPITSDASGDLHQPWTSQTSQTAAEALSQLNLIQKRIIEHEGSSPAPILSSVNQLAKATVAISYQFVKGHGRRGTRWFRVTNSLY
jgi:hypothetical protein